MGRIPTAQRSPHPRVVSNAQSPDRFFPGKPVKQGFLSQMGPDQVCPGRRWGSCSRGPAGGGGARERRSSPPAAPTLLPWAVQRLLRIQVNFHCFDLKKVQSRKGNLEKTKLFFHCLRMKFLKKIIKLH